MSNPNETRNPKKRGRGRPKGSKNKQPASIASIIRQGLKAGKTPEQIIAAVKKAFPDAKTSAATVHNYRSQLRKEGVDIPTVRGTKAKAARKTRKATKRRTITQAIHDALLAGKTNDEVLDAVKAEFPKAKTSRNSVVIQRSALRKAGKAVPASWDAQRAAKAATPGAPNSKAAKTVAIASDHAGIALKTVLKKVLKQQGLVALDLGTRSNASVDYPEFADLVAEAMERGFATRGIVICGSGIGISIAANRHRNVRAALCTNGLMARLAREHNDANVLALGARLIGSDMATECLLQFLNTPFAQGRHVRRVKQMS